MNLKHLRVFPLMLKILVIRPVIFKPINYTCNLSQRVIFITITMSVVNIVQQSCRVQNIKQHGHYRDAIDYPDYTNTDLD